MNRLLNRVNKIFVMPERLEASPVANTLQEFLIAVAYLQYMVLHCNPQGDTTQGFTTKEAQ